MLEFDQDFKLHREVETWVFTCSFSLQALSREFFKCKASALRGVFIAEIAASSFYDKYRHLY